MTRVAGAWQGEGPNRHPLTGREIASVMGAAGADWLERPEREAEENPEQALDAIGITPGMVVADVGAGVGYMTLRLARRVGATGKVYANDLQPEMIERLRRNIKSAGITNIETVLGTESDPRLPGGQIDLILLVDVYHEFSRPREMLQQLRTALKPGGRLVLLEYRKEDPAVPIRADHKMSVAEVRTEVEIEGFVLSQTIETLPRQHILVFGGATLKDTMTSVVAPASEKIFNSVRVEIDRTGVRNFSPGSPAEWEDVRLAALRLAESTNLLLMGGSRVQDRGPDWPALSAELKAASLAAVTAAGAKSADSLMLAGGRIYEACTSCHKKYDPGGSSRSR
jgi:SAM-dependent methyltransferase